ncbi:GatB/YqeY domain-containing protein [Blastococcus sp. URHD0036]|uniref:GatB/YqeY domain-containing protein n=1 Tax=Blastococcus sp. URHD0036 TaxID=1380356 RepID=UPI000496A6F4|nr:GatB/YqeY domain-containing protein [Blastococcus sp. URHD0036]
MTDDPAAQLRATLRADLRAAMKAREKEAVSALRTALAAIDNAEAVEVAPTAAEDGSAHVAGARAGVGATEAERCTLSLAEVRTLLRQQVDERDTEAARWEVDRPDAAARLRGEADALRAYLAT